MKIGFVIHILDNPADDNQAPRYADIRKMALKAEQTGFDSIWVYDHLLYRPKNENTIGIWECWTILSALAEATNKVKLGTLVICNSFRNPAILAKMAHTIDEVSNGRFILGIGAGWNKPEYDAFGIPFDHRVNKFEEAVQIIKPLLNEGHVDFKGKYYQAVDCEITPRGPRDKIPLMIGSYKPRMMRLTAKYADIWNTAYLDMPNSLDEPLSLIHKACDEMGRDKKSLEITATIHLVYRDLTKPSNQIKNYLNGSIENIVDVLRQYKKLGVSHLMIHISPYNNEGFDRVADTLQAYHD